jgi:hypothetical protein
MANVKITELPLLLCVNSCTSLIPIEQGGVTYSTYACNVGGGGGGFTIANSIVGCCNSLNVGACNSMVSGFGNVAASTNSSILSGAFNVIACDALPNTQSGGYFNGFVSGQTTFSAGYGDLTAYYTVGSTVSSQYVYGTTQCNYFDMVVCGSSFDGTATTICVDPTINTCSGYIIKSGTFSTYSSYHPNTISGGAFNTISGYTSASTISGGYLNTISNGYSFIGGGEYNIVGLCYQGSGFIGAGAGNCIQGNNSFIGAGVNNFNCGSYAFIGGGFYNCATNTYSVIGGGYRNTASGYMSGILSGRYNIACATYSTIVGGFTNISCGNYSTISGGYCNTNYGNFSSILGGCNNTNYQNYSSILGGNNNVACGQY